MGLPFEAVCRDWVRLASAASVLSVRVGRVGTWWAPQNEVDVVGLDDARQVATVGECTWRNRPFDWDELQTYPDHVRALGAVAPVRPDALHLLFSKSGFTDSVRAWVERSNARLLTPSDLLAPL